MSSSFPTELLSAWQDRGEWTSRSAGPVTWSCSSPSFPWLVPISLLCSLHHLQPSPTTELTSVCVSLKLVFSYPTPPSWLELYFLSASRGFPRPFANAFDFLSPTGPTCRIHLLRSNPPLTLPPSCPLLSSSRPSETKHFFLRQHTITCAQDLTTTKHFPQRARDPKPSPMLNKYPLQSLPSCHLSLAQPPGTSPSLPLRAEPPS